MRSFDAFHPLSMFCFFACAIILTVIAPRPLFQAIAALAAACLYVSIRGRSAFKAIGGLAAAFVVIALINPLFTTMGSDVLFTYLGGRPYTLQGLAYGASTSAMFVTIMLWFGSFNRLMTTDRLMHLFGTMAPSLTLVLTMVLRLIPSYQRKASQISTARTCIGRSALEGSLPHRVQDGMDILSSLAAWSLEAGIITADSMRSRGHGSGPRTSFALHRIRARDVALLIIMASCFAMVCASALSGSLDATYLPRIQVAPLAASGWAALACFSIVLFAPFAINMKEAIQWRCSMSRI